MKFNTATYTVFISLEDYIKAPWGGFFFTFLPNLGTVVANELHDIFPSANGALIEAMYDSIYDFYYNQSYKTTFIKSFIHKIYYVGKSILAFAMISTFTGLTLRFGMIIILIITVWICKLYE